jgi:type IV secretory pathway TraG/TraD family ATPase VirD4
MVSRQETARQLLTPGEVMQLPPHEELVLVSGLAPIRAASCAITSIPISPSGPACA